MCSGGGGGGRGRHLGEGAGHLAHLFLEQLARLQGDIERYREIYREIVCPPPSRAARRAAG